MLISRGLVANIRMYDMIGYSGKNVFGHCSHPTAGDVQVEFIRYRNYFSDSDRCLFFSEAAKMKMKNNKNDVVLVFSSGIFRFVAHLERLSVLPVLFILSQTDRNT